MTVASRRRGWPDKPRHREGAGRIRVPLRKRVQGALCFIVCVTILLAPAIWNRFPLLQYDTGGYLARWYEGTLVPSRAVAYGLMLTASAPLAFWPLLLVQSGLTVWILALTLRAHG